MYPFLSRSRRSSSSSLSRFSCSCLSRRRLLPSSFICRRLPSKAWWRSSLSCLARRALSDEISRQYLVCRRFCPDGISELCDVVDGSRLSGLDQVVVARHGCDSCG
ncbi:hypothetical protein KCU81_g302, partial [Aureobasidium melanogenum]